MKQSVVVLLSLLSVGLTTCSSPHTVLQQQAGEYHISARPVHIVLQTGDTLRYEAEDTEIVVTQSGMIIRAAFSSTPDTITWYQMRTLTFPAESYRLAVMEGVSGGIWVSLGVFTLLSILFSALGSA